MKAHRYLPALIFATALAAPACAAQVYGYRAPDVRYERDFERRAYDNGFREGIEEARNDVRRGRSFDMNRHDEYRDADEGYHRRDGDRDFYRRVYRRGFEAGYRQTFDREAGGYERGRGFGGPVYQEPRGPVFQEPRVVTPGGGYIASPAAQNGYRDGFEVGRDDARDRNSFDPIRAKRYREGDHDYDRRYGDRDDYKRDYRAAFQQGYREGYERSR